MESGAPETAPDGCPVQASCGGCIAERCGSTFLRTSADTLAWGCPHIPRALKRSGTLLSSASAARPAPAQRRLGPTAKQQCGAGSRSLSGAGGGRQGQRRATTPSPPAVTNAMTIPDSGRKRAGEWLNSELDLDSYKTSKRYRSSVSTTQEVQAHCAAVRCVAVPLHARMAACQSHITLTAGYRLRPQRHALGGQRGYRPACHRPACRRQ